MAAPVPAEESVNLHNRLLDLSFEEDLAEIEQIQWRLKTVVSRQPDDVDARVTLIEAYRSGGSRAGAVDLANQVFQHHASLELRVLETYLAELVGLGLYDRAKPLCMQLASDRTPGRNSSLLANASCAAVASGDVSWLEEIASVDDDTCPAVQYLDVIKRSGLAEQFENHQRIANGYIGTRQCGVAVSDSYDPIEPDDLRCIVTYVFVPEDRTIRRGLERDIHTAHEEYYSSRNVAPGRYIGHFHTILTGVPFPRRRRG